MLLNSRLGTYTNFVNLLDLCAIAAPSGMRGDGLPSSVTLIAPAGADGLVAGLAAEIHARSGRAHGRDRAAGAEAAPAPRASAPPGRIGLAVVGAHLAGLPLNPRTLALGASFVGEVETGARLPALRARRVEAGETRPGSGRRRRRRGDQGGGLGARPRELRRFRRQDSGAARHRDPAALGRLDGQGLSWPSPRGSGRDGHFRVRRLAAYLASLGPAAEPPAGVRRSRRSS